MTVVLTAHAGDLGAVPLAVVTAADGGHVSLDEAMFAVVAHQGVDLVARLHGAKHPGISHNRGLAARHWGRTQTQGLVFVLMSCVCVCVCVCVSVYVCIPVPFLQVKLR